MRRIVFIALMCCLGAAFAQGTNHRIVARAGFRIVHENEVGACSIVIDMTNAKGMFQYAAEDHSGDLLCALPSALDSFRYPEVVIKTTRVRSAIYQGTHFTMIADGTSQGDPVKIEFKAVDNGRNGDSFEIRVTDLNGGLVYQRGGTIDSGDISIR